MFVYPETMTAMTDVSEFPDEFNNVILANVFEYFSASQGNIQMAAYWSGKFEQGVLTGRRKANERNTSGNITITPYYF
jgi:hypothetical protein